MASSTGIEKLESKEIITPGWKTLNVGWIEENHGGSISQALEMEKKMSNEG